MKWDKDATDIITEDSGAVVSVLHHFGRVRFWKTLASLALLAYSAKI